MQHQAVAVACHDLVVFEALMLRQKPNGEGLGAGAVGPAGHPLLSTFTPSPPAGPGVLGPGPAGASATCIILPPSARITPSPPAVLGSWGWGRGRRAPPRPAGGAAACVAPPAPAHKVQKGQVKLVGRPRRPVQLCDSGKAVCLQQRGCTARPCCCRQTFP